MSAIDFEDDRDGCIFKAMGVAHAGKLLEDIPNKVRDILGIMLEWSPDEVT